MPLGYGKYVRSERVAAIMSIEEERGPGRRTFVFVDGQTEPLVASLAEDAIVRDIVRDRSRLDLNVIERRAREALEEEGE